MANYKEEIEYVLTAIKTNRGAIAAEVAKDLDKNDHKSAKRIADDAPEGLDKDFILSVFDVLGEEEYLYYTDYSKRYMLSRSVAEVEDLLNRFLEGE